MYQFLEKLIRETLFSLKLATANPIMFAQHPTVAAPAASPLKFKIIESAAELIGNVKIIPIITETNIPIIIGCLSTDQLINSPNKSIVFDIVGPTSNPIVPPINIVTNGITIMSILVFPVKNLPISIPIIEAINAPKGSPGPFNKISFPIY
jgi:hypothetical protein